MVAVGDHRNDCSDAVFDMNPTYSFCVRSRITEIARARSVLLGIVHKVLCVSPAVDNG